MQTVTINNPKNILVGHTFPPYITDVEKRIEVYNSEGIRVYGFDVRRVGENRVFLDFADSMIGEVLTIKVIPFTTKKDFEELKDFNALTESLFNVGLIDTKPENLDEDANLLAAEVAIRRTQIAPNEIMINTIEAFTNLPYSLNFNTFWHLMLLTKYIQSIFSVEYENLPSVFQGSTNYNYFVVYSGSGVTTLRVQASGSNLTPVFTGSDLIMGTVRVYKTKEKRINIYGV